MHPRPGQPLNSEQVEFLRTALADRYRIDREIGSGGMASVYLAQDVRHDRGVAIKILRPELAAVMGVARFLQEIAIAARLNHPLILPLYDSGETRGLPWFVMPYIEGETLRARLDRETQLPIDEALAIARDVGEALGYAHAAGIVHRDIKPENILLKGGRALVADFGIARAITRAVPEERLTESGMRVGTPAYMSPEQAGGTHELDGRSDIYALGCVLYEMLGGQPPFTGPSSQAILSRHQLDDVPPLRTVRRTVPVGVERAVLRALAKVPADRFPTTERFNAALAGADSAEWLREARPAWRRPAVLVGAAVVVVVAAGVGLARGPLRRSAGNGAPPVDTSHYVILPAVTQGSIEASLDVEQLLRDALTRWEGISVADQFQVRDALARRGTAPLGPGDALRLARDQGAGRYLRAEVSRIGDSLRVHAALHDATHEGAQLKEFTVHVAPDLSGADSAFALLADRLLFRDSAGAPPTGREVGTRSLAARQAFVRGQAAIEQWDLVAADTAFAAAGRFDGQYAQSLLWLALARWWADSPAATWRSASERAVAGSARLGGRDRALAAALASLGRDSTVAACSAFGRLATASAYDFAPWYSWATCLRRDSVVVRGRSPSGWVFRSSYQQASRAYHRAFVLLPSLHRSLRPSLYRSVRRALMTGTNDLRYGRALPPDTAGFLSMLALLGDTLVAVPYPRADVVAARQWTVPPSNREALRRQRESFREIASAWAADYPASGDAQEALALSLELLGDPACLDTLRRARSLAGTSSDQVRLAAAEVWLRLKFAIPARPEAVRIARALADSLLAGAPSSGAAEPAFLASLAAVTGRAVRAAALLAEPAARPGRQTPASLSIIGPTLVMFAALGGPVDSLRALEQRVRRALAVAVVDPARPVARAAFLVRPATLAFPAYRIDLAGSLDNATSPIAAAQDAFARGDSGGARRILAVLRDGRRLLRPGDLTFDALYPEAELLSAMGDSADAAAWLDPTLDALATTAPQVFSDPARAGSLVQAMALRADLAERLGDRMAARKWATMVMLLWSDADAFLRPTVDRMTRLARQN